MGSPPFDLRMARNKVSLITKVTAALCVTMQPAQNEAQIQQGFSKWIPGTLWVPLGGSKWTFTSSLFTVCNSDGIEMEPNRFGSIRVMWNLV